MITFFLLLMSTQNTHQSKTATDNQSWTTQLSQKILRKALSGNKAAQKISHMTSDPNFYVFDGKSIRIATKDEIDAMTRVELGPHQEWSRAQGLARNGQLEEAKRKVAELMDGSPLRRNESLALAEIALFEENYDEALLVLAPFVDGSTDEWTLVMAAYAGAMTGNVFEGQMDYLRITVRADESRGFPIGPTHPNMSRRNVEKLVASIGMAKLYGQHGIEFANRRYLEKALYFDPDNPWANYRLAIIHRRHELWTLAAQRYKIAADNSEGKLKEWIMGEWGVANDFAIRPRRTGQGGGNQ